VSGDCELYCDLDAMEALGSQLDSIHSSLDEVGDRVDVYDASLGSSSIEDAIDSFVGGWRDGRKEIRKGVEAASANVKKAAETYRLNEEKLASAARGESTP
jgi:hypothetical protein